MAKRGKKPGAPKATSKTASKSAGRARGAKSTPKAGGAGGHRVRGMGIGLKIALAFAATIAVLLGLGGFIIYNQTAAALDEAIDSYGSTVARTLALQSVDEWRETFNKKPARVRGITYVRAGSDKIDVDIVDVFVLNYATKKLVAKANPKSGQFTPFSGTARNYVAVGSDGTEIETSVEITEGTISRGSRDVPARSYVQPIYDGGKKEGEVYVFLSEDRVAARKSKLAMSILGITFAVLVAGVLVSLWIGKALTTPLVKLVGVVDAVANGDYDRSVVGHTRDEIGVLALSVSDMTDALKEAEENKDTLEEREREMSLVADLRRNLLPNEVPMVKGFELEASYRPSKRVGGNYYDFLELPGGKIGVLVANTAGEGVLAGFTMNLFRGFVHAETGWESDPVKMLGRVNRHLSRDIKKGVYVTAFLIVVEPGNRELTLVNAGHLPLLLYSAKEKKLRIASTEGIALGFDAGPIFEQRLKATRLTLEPGDRVVTYTEGVYKIQNEEGEELGETGFNKLVSKNAPMHSAAFINLVERSMEKFREGGEETGDYTILTLKAM